MESTFAWLESTWLAQLVLGNSWVFPTLETLHFLGLILLIGSLFVIDLRFLGVARRIPPAAVLAFLPWTFIGFGINLVTGILFFVSNPSHYYPNLSFRLKMLTLLLAGLNALWFRLAVHPQVVAPGAMAEIRANAKFIAALSMLLWLTVIVFGRLIPYLK